MTELRTYTDKEIELALAGPHRTWDTYDMQNEGVRIHGLHTLASADVFDESEARATLGELAQLSRSYGYASCDSLLFELGSRIRADLDEDTVMQIHFDNLFGNEDEDGYFHDVNSSERKLWETAKTTEARNFLKGDHIAYNGYNGILSSTMLDAFRQGRDMKALESGRQDLVSESSLATLTP